MIRKIFAAGAVAFGLMVGGASAADVKGPILKAPPAVFNWTGFYVGGHVGYAFGSYDLVNIGVAGAGPIAIDVDNVIGGIHVGYNWQFGNPWLIGIEADFQNGPKGTRPVGTATPALVCATGECNISIHSFGTIRGRLGIVRDRVLFYGTAGYAYANVSGGIFNSAQQSGTRHESGYTVGAGFDYAMTRNWILKVEYLYVDLGDLPFGPLAGSTVTGLGDFHVLKLGANYKF